MADPALTVQYLPPVLTDFQPIYDLLEEVKLPRPESVQSLSSSGAFHVIYRLTYPPEVLKDILSDIPFHGKVSDTNLILRVSGSHYATIKTQNECAAMRWVAENTSIPVPAVVRYHATENNPLGKEYIIMTQAEGQTLDRIYDEFVKLDEATQHRFYDQLADITHELHQHTWSQIGGLKETREDEPERKPQIVPGPIVDETMWQVHELASVWGGSETHESLNVGGPFDTYADLLRATVEKHLHAITTHPSFAPLQDLIPTIHTYLAALQTHAAAINDTRFVLAHRDLHYGNILYDLSTRTITAIIDWEFAGVVPLPRWDPSRAFMWTAQNKEDDLAVKYQLREVVFERARRRGITVFDDAAYKNSRQEHAQMAERFLGAICQVLPRGQAEKPWRDWRRTFEEHVAALCREESS